MLFVPGDVHAETKLLPQNLLQRATVPKVNPFAHSRTLLFVHALALDRPVEALRAGDGRREPDLLVGRLLVKYVGSVGWVGDVEDAGLSIR